MHRRLLVTIAFAGLAAAQEPYAFLVNQGQWPSQVRAGVRHGGQTTWLTDTGWTTQVVGTDWQPGPGAMLGRDLPPPLHAAVIEVELLGGTQAKDTLHDPLPGTVGFFLGNDARKHAPSVPKHARAERRNAWPGVDLAFATREGNVAFDLHFAAGVAAATARYRVQGAQRLAIDADGALVMDVGFGTVRHGAPRAWQLAANGAREDLPVHFVLDGDVVGFAVDGRDAQRELLIDPALVWVTLLGGSGADVPGLRQGVDRRPGVVVTCGNTNSFAFPAAGFGTRGNKDGYLVVDTRQPLTNWSAYIGGTLDDEIWAVRFDGGDLLFAGHSTSSNFPLMNPAQTTNRGGAWGDGILGRIAYTPPIGFPPVGTYSLAWSSYWGTPGDENLLAVAALASGRVAVTGFSTGSLAVGSQSPPRVGAEEGYTAIFDPSQVGAAQWVTAVWAGGAGSDIPQSIQTDHLGNLVVGGWTTSASGFAMNANAFQANYQGGQTDGFVLVYDATLSTRLYSTFLGGAGSDEADDTCFDSQNRLVIGSFVGGIAGMNFAMPATAYDTTPNGDIYDGYALVLDWTLPPAQQLVWGTYLGGSKYDGVNGIAIDSADRITVVGPVQGDGPGTTTFPRTDWCLQQFVGGTPGPLGGQWDAFAARFDLRRTGNDQLVDCTFLGGTGFDYSYDVVLDARAMPVSVGPTNSSPFRGVNGLGGTDHFVAELDLLATVADRYGSNTGCSVDGEIFLDAYHRQTATGFDLTVTCSNTAPAGLGVFVFGAPDPVGAYLPSVGCLTWLQIGQPIVGLGAVSDGVGYASLRFLVNAPPPVLNVAVQAVWLGSTCSPLLASDAIRL